MNMRDEEYKDIPEEDYEFFVLGDPIYKHL